jgi:IS30 family transposase
MRHYLPKKSDLSLHILAELDQIALRLNQRRERL